MGDLSGELGTYHQSLYTGINSSTSASASLLHISFTANSTVYKYIPALPVCPSTQKCQISAQYQSYQIFRGGITIPIALNFTLCKPISPLAITAVLNSTALEVDTTLSTSEVSLQSGDMAYLVLRHDYSSPPVGTTYSLQIELSSASSVTEWAYEAI